MLLFTVLFLWFVNYAGVFSSDFGQVSATTQVGAVAASVAKAASAACAYQVSASLQLPCVSRAGQRLGIAIFASSSTTINVTVAGEPAYASAIAVCPVTVSLSSACTNGTVGDWICIAGSNGVVSVSKGRC